MKHFTDLLSGRTQPTTRMAQAALTLLGGIGHLYGTALRLRAELYRQNRLTSYRAPCPVISVGNLTAGGTGKTPMVLWLAQQLRPHKRLAIVSRGYGTPVSQLPGQPAGITLVADPDGVRLAPPQAADEAALLARNLPGVAILTGADRARLIRYAVAQYGVELILMDDGFQHLRVQRDLDLVLLDARHPLGNGSLLPGGLLREWPGALQRCDALVLTRCATGSLFEQAQAVLTRIAPGKPLLRADHQPTAWIQPGREHPLALSALGQTPVLAFCGIARPDSFAELLARIGTQTSGLQSFPDHCAYTRAHWDALVHRARATGAQALVCTEKDAVKIPPEWLHATAPALPLYFLRMEMHFLAEPVWLRQRLAELVGH